LEVIIPILLLVMFIAAAYKKTSVYDSFVRGAKNALPVLVSILPYLAAMLAAINIFRASGALQGFIDLSSPVMESIGIPKELTPLVVLRPFSGSAAIALLDDIFKTCGPDSYQGILASVMLGSTETIFYTVALYFGSIGIKKTRYSIPTALISGIAGIAASIIAVKLMYD
jgi:spore maturation protein B